MDSYWPHEIAVDAEDDTVVSAADAGGIRGDSVHY